jgi:hypothetical protein
MIGKTWRKATSNKPPGIVDCSVPYGKVSW